MFNGDVLGFSDQICHCLVLGILQFDYLAYSYYIFNTSKSEQSH